VGEVIAEYTDIPPGVVNVISSTDAQVGVALTTSPDVDVVTFTGSTATGRKIMAAASDTIKKVFLELGGKSAMIVLDDADFNTCDDGGLHDLLACRAGCAITTRLLVPRTHQDEIVGMVKNYLSMVRYGDPAEPDTYMGPLISETSATRSTESCSAPSRPARRWLPAAEGRGPGLLLRAHPADRRGSGQRDRPGGDLRAGACGAGLRR
jgi:acyl-CoA reductase-like NAD-dependent aldehyde dehydrogenase